MVVRNESKIPLGFITPWGEDKAAQKRMATVDSWCSNTRKGSLPTSVIENTPMLGFKMSGDIRRGMQGGQDKWRIEDPRGFELEISSGNLCMLLADTTLEKGEILDKCVWARQGGQNVLLTVESEEYIEAVRMTSIATSTASWKDVEIGYNIVLQNGFEGMYLGRMHVLQEKSRDSSKSKDNMIECPNKLMHVILKPTTDRTYLPGVCRELHFFGSPKLSRVIGGTEITVAEAEIIANEAIQNSDCVLSHSGYRDILLAVANPIKDQSWRLVLINASNDVDPWKRTYVDKTCLIRLKDGSIGLPHVGNDGIKNIMMIKEAELATGIYDLDATLHTRDRYYTSGGKYWDGTLIPINVKDVVSVHHLRVELDSKAGNTVWGIV
jgi:hypothetical protein